MNTSWTTQIIWVITGSLTKLAKHELQALWATLEWSSIIEWWFRATNAACLLCRWDASVELRLSRMWTMIKWWVVYESVQELFDALWPSQATLIGTADQKLWVLCKREHWAKRFKEVKPLHTDREIVESGREIQPLQNWSVLLVTWYQQIDRYAAIEYDKPVRGMQVGMMPAALAQSLVSIAMGTHDEWTVYDPFCGFWTTNFVANSNGFNTIGSDINPTPAKQNLSRWQEQQFATDKRITFFKHDVTEPFDKPYLKYVTGIATEGWLWPALKAWFARQMSRQQQSEIQDEITILYTAWIINHKNSPCSSAPIVCTFPQRTFIDEDMSRQWRRTCKEVWVQVEELELYKKKGQRVARRVFRIN